MVIGAFLMEPNFRSSGGHLWPTPPGLGERRVGNNCGGTSPQLGTRGLHRLA
jgi:hypothetical protein